jgi:hypothetical protein
MREEEAQICGTRCLNLELGFWDLGFMILLESLRCWTEGTRERCGAASDTVAMWAFLLL